VESEQTRFKAFAASSTRLPGQHGSYLPREAFDVGMRTLGDERPNALSQALVLEGNRRQAPTALIRSTHDTTLARDVTVREHSRMVGEAIDGKADELYAIFWSKIQIEAAKAREEARRAAAKEREGLQQVIGSYQMKFEEIDHYFDEIKEAKRYIEALAKENSILRQLTKKATETFNVRLHIGEADREDEAHKAAEEKAKTEYEAKTSLAEEERLSAQNEEHRRAKGLAAERRQSLIAEQEAAFLDNEDQMALLHQQLAAQEEEVRLLELEKEACRQEALESQLLLESRAREEREKADEAEALLKLAREAVEEEKRAAGADDLAVRETRAQSKSVQGEIRHEKEQLVALEMDTLDLEEECEAITDTLAETKGKFKGEVEKGIDNHEGLIKEISKAAGPFYDHFKMVEKELQQVSNIDDWLGIDIICGICLNTFKNPVIMWPCGHTLCQRCQGVEAECVECCVQRTETDLEDEDTGDLGENADDTQAYTNPFMVHGDHSIDFDGTFYKGPNHLMELFLKGFQKAKSELEVTMKAFHIVSKLYLVVSRYEVFERITGLGEKEYSELYGHLPSKSISGRMSRRQTASTKGSKRASQAQEVRPTTQSRTYFREKGRQSVSVEVRLTAADVMNDIEGDYGDFSEPGSDSNNRWETIDEIPEWDSERNVSVSETVLEESKTPHKVARSELTSA
jgi:chemotaxis protein histidine kinase CheA